MAQVKPSQKPHGLSRAERLQRRRDFEHVYEAGLRLRARNFALFAAPNDLGFSRLGVVASRKVGGAVRRNRARRLLREAFRLNKNRLRCPCDVILVASPSWQILRLSEVEPDLQQLLEKVNATLSR